MVTSEVGIDTRKLAMELRRAAVEAAPSWVERTVGAVAGSGGVVVDATELAALVSDVVVDLETRFLELAETDIDRQRTTPLSIFRAACEPVADFLRARSVPPVAAEGVDPYGIHPAQLADIGPAVHEAGMMWGAAKAAVHLQRRRDEGLI